MTGEIALVAALKVLAIGNSFSASLGPYFGEVARAAGCEVDFCAVSIGGCTLERHMKEIGISETNSAHFGCWALWTYASEGWTKRPKWADRVCRGDGKNLNELDALRADNWDVVTIQQASQSSWRAETFEPWATKLIDVIRREAPQAEIVIQETWSYNSRESHLNDGAGRKGSWNIDNGEMYRRLSENYRRLSADHGNLRIIPTGTAVENFRRLLGTYDPAKDVVGRDRERDGKKLYDGIHLNPDGQYLQALVWTAKLFNRDISSVGFVPTHLRDNPERVAAIKNAATAAVERDAVFH